MTLFVCAAQEVMQRGAEGLGKMINKGFDRQLPSTGLKAGFPGDSGGSQWAQHVPLSGLQGQSLQQDPSLTSSETLAEEQTAHDNRAARQWVQHTDADDEEMSRL